MIFKLQKIEYLGAFQKIEYIRRLRLKPIKKQFHKKLKVS